MTELIAVLRIVANISSATAARALWMISLVMTASGLEEGAPPCRMAKPNAFG